MSGQYVNPQDYGVNPGSTSSYSQYQQQQSQSQQQYCSQQMQASSQRQQLHGHVASSSQTSSSNSAAMVPNMQHERVISCGNQAEICDQSDFDVYYDHCDEFQFSQFTGTKELQQHNQQRYSMLEQQQKSQQQLSQQQMKNQPTKQTQLEFDPSADSRTEYQIARQLFFEHLKNDELNIQGKQQQQQQPLFGQEEVEGQNIQSVLQSSSQVASASPPFSSMNIYQQLEEQILISGEGLSQQQQQQYQPRLSSHSAAGLFHRTTNGSSNRHFLQQEQELLEQQKSLQMQQQRQQQEQFLQDQLREEAARKYEEEVIQQWNRLQFMRDGRASVNARIVSWLYVKYASSQNYYYTRDVNEILMNSRTRAVIDFKDRIVLDEDAEFLKRFYARNEYAKKAKLLTEYYKFHKDIPRLFMIPETYVLNHFHDKKRRFDYYRIAELIEEENKLNPDRPPKGIVGEKPQLVTNESELNDPDDPENNPNIEGGQQQQRAKRVLEERMLDDISSFINRGDGEDADQLSCNESQPPLTSERAALYQLNRFSKQNSNNKRTNNLQQQSSVSQNAILNYSQKLDQFQNSKKSAAVAASTQSSREQQLYLSEQNNRKISSSSTSQQQQPSKQSKQQQYFQNQNEKNLLQYQMKIQQQSQQQQQQQPVLSASSITIQELNWKLEEIVSGSQYSMSRMAAFDEMDDTNYVGFGGTTTTGAAGNNTSRLKHFDSNNLEQFLTFLQASDHQPQQQQQQQKNQQSSKVAAAAAATAAVVAAQSSQFTTLSSARSQSDFLLNLKSLIHKQDSQNKQHQQQSQQRNDLNTGASKKSKQQNPIANAQQAHMLVEQQQQQYQQQQPQRMQKNSSESKSNQQGASGQQQTQNSARTKKSPAGQGLQLRLEDLDYFTDQQQQQQQLHHPQNLQIATQQLSTKSLKSKTNPKSARDDHHHHHNNAIGYSQQNNPTVQLASSGSAFISLSSESPLHALSIPRRQQQQQQQQQLSHLHQQQQIQKPALLQEDLSGSALMGPQSTKSRQAPHQHLTLSQGPIPHNLLSSQQLLQQQIMMSSSTAKLETKDSQQLYTPRSLHSLPVPSSLLISSQFNSINKMNAATAASARNHVSHIPSKPNLSPRDSLPSPINTAPSSFVENHNQNNNASSSNGDATSNGGLTLSRSIPKKVAATTSSQQSTQQQAQVSQQQPSKLLAHSKQLGLKLRLDQLNASKDKDHNNNNGAAGTKEPSSQRSNSGKNIDLSTPKYNFFDIFRQQVADQMKANSQAPQIIALSPSSSSTVSQIVLHDQSNQHVVHHHHHSQQQQNSQQFVIKSNNVSSTNLPQQLQQLASQNGLPFFKSVSPSSMQSSLPTTNLDFQKIVMSSTNVQGMSPSSSQSPPPYFLASHLDEHALAGYNSNSVAVTPTVGSASNNHHGINKPSSRSSQSQQIQPFFPSQASLLQQQQQQQLQLQQQQSQHNNSNNSQLTSNNRINPSSSTTTAGQTIGNGIKSPKGIKQSQSTSSNPSQHAANTVVNNNTSSHNMNATASNTVFSSLASFSTKPLGVSGTNTTTNAGVTASTKSLSSGSFSLSQLNRKSTNSIVSIPIASPNHSHSQQLLKDKTPPVAQQKSRQQQQQQQQQLLSPELQSSQLSQQQQPKKLLSVQITKSEAATANHTRKNSQTKPFFFDKPSQQYQQYQQQLNQGTEQATNSSSSIGYVFGTSQQQQINAEKNSMLQSQQQQVSRNSSLDVNPSSLSAKLGIKKKGQDSLFSSSMSSCQTPKETKSIYNLLQQQQQLQQYQQQHLQQQQQHLNNSKVTTAKPASVSARTHKSSEPSQLSLAPFPFVLQENKSLGMIAAIKGNSQPIKSVPITAGIAISVTGSNKHNLEPGCESPQRKHQQHLQQSSENPSHGMHVRPANAQTPGSVAPLIGASKKPVNHHKHTKSENFSSENGNNPNMILLNNPTGSTAATPQLPINIGSVSSSKHALSNSGGTGLKNNNPNEFLSPQSSPFTSNQSANSHQVSALASQFGRSIQNPIVISYSFPNSNSTTTPSSSVQAATFATTATPLVVPVPNTHLNSQQSPRISQSNAMQLAASGSMTPISHNSSGSTAGMKAKKTSGIGSSNNGCNNNSGTNGVQQQLQSQQQREMFRSTNNSSNCGNNNNSNSNNHTNTNTFTGGVHSQNLINTSNLNSPLSSGNVLYNMNILTHHQSNSHNQNSSSSNSASQHANASSSSNANVNSNNNNNNNNHASNLSAMPSPTNAQASKKNPLLVQSPISGFFATTKSQVAQQQQQQQNQQLQQQSPQQQQMQLSQLQQLQSMNPSVISNNLLRTTYDNTSQFNASQKLAKRKQGQL